MNASVVTAIACVGIFAAAIAPSSAQPVAKYDVPVQVRVVDAHGKSVPNVLLRGCDLRASQTCDVIVAQAYANKDGVAVLGIPVPAWPDAFRVELVNPTRSELVVLYLTLRRCELGYTQQYAATAISCGNRARSQSSAFQPASTSDTYNLGASQIQTLLGKRH